MHEKPKAFVDKLATFSRVLVFDQLSISSALVESREGT
jgi:hypothetical protein